MGAGSKSLLALFSRSKKGAEQIAPRPPKSRYCPSLLPTRLADGLELEVFYVKLFAFEHLTIRPCFACCETSVPPCCTTLIAAPTLADKNVNRRHLTPPPKANQFLQNDFSANDFIHRRERSD